MSRLVGATIFVPTDEALASFKDSIGADRYARLFADPSKLADLVLYHVVDKRYDRDGLLAASRGVATLYGGVLTVRSSRGTVSVTDGARNTARVLCGNIPTANATVFLIDRVLVASPDKTDV